MFSKNPEAPAKLKGECINQLDHLLFALGCSESIVVSLLPNIVDEHIPTPLILDTLGQINELSIRWMPLNQVEDGIYTKSPLFCVTGNGDSFLLVEKHEGKHHLQVFNKPDDVIESFWVTSEEMTNDLGILPQALVITKKSPLLPWASPYYPRPAKTPPMMIMRVKNTTL